MSAHDNVSSKGKHGQEAFLKYGQRLWRLNKAWFRHSRGARAASGRAWVRELREEPNTRMKIKHKCASPWQKLYRCGIRRQSELRRQTEVSLRRQVFRHKLSQRRSHRKKVHQAVKAIDTVWLFSCKMSNLRKEREPIQNLNQHTIGTFHISCQSKNKIIWFCLQSFFAYVYVAWLMFPTKIWVQYFINHMWKFLRIIIDSLEYLSDFKSNFSHLHNFIHL